jgi:hypothetical protein
MFGDACKGNILPLFALQDNRSAASHSRGQRGMRGPSLRRRGGVGGIAGSPDQLPRDFPGGFSPVNAGRSTFVTIRWSGGRSSIFMSMVGSELVGHL